MLPFWDMWPSMGTCMLFSCIALYWIEKIFFINYFQKLQILHTYISLKYWCIYMSNMTNLPFLLLTSYNHPFLNPLVVLEWNFVQDDATKKLYYCTLVKPLLLFWILISGKLFNVFTGQMQIIEERMFILWPFKKSTI